MINEYNWWGTKHWHSVILIHFKSQIKVRHLRLPFLQLSFFEVFQVAGGCFKITLIMFFEMISIGANPCHDFRESKSTEQSFREYD